MSPEVKIRTLASQDATLQSFLGTNPFRWFDIQLPQGQPTKTNNFWDGPAVTCLSVSLMSQYVHGNGRSQIAWPRFQIDILDTDAERGRNCAAAVIAWLNKANISQPGQFGCPATSVTLPAPNILLNNRGGTWADLQPPVFRQTLDVRFANTELV